MEMKPMVYGAERKDREILFTGLYRGTKFYILSYHTHPCAYIKTPVDGDAYDFFPPCNGGITFDSNRFSGHYGNSLFGIEEGHFIGWDYAHLGDYYPPLDFSYTDQQKAWTTEEIYAEVRAVIDYLQDEYLKKTKE